MILLHLIRHISKNNSLGIIVLMLTFTACCNCGKNSTNNNYEKKFDAALKIEMSKNESGTDSRQLTCFVELTQKIDDYIKAKLENSGLRIITIVENIITCEGSRDEFIQAAQYDFVKRIELSKKLMPQKNE